MIIILQCLLFFIFKIHSIYLYDFWKYSLTAIFRTQKDQKYVVQKDFGFERQGKVLAFIEARKEV